MKSHSPFSVRYIYIYMCFQSTSVVRCEFKKVQPVSTLYKTESKYVYTVSPDESLISQ